MQLVPPQADEIEISLFGRGFGEAVCIHMGSGEWACIDSCREPTQNSPAALSYLEAIGLDAKEVVKLIVATHWDDDHVEGLAAIVEACPGATVALSAAVLKKEFLAYTIVQEGAGGAHGSGVDELRRILRLQEARRSPPVRAIANRPLHPQPPGDSPRMIALSPSDDALERSLQALISGAEEAPLDGRRRYRAPESPNGASVATWLRNGDTGVLLGADLECTANKDAGWDAVLTHAMPPIKLCAIKVPHHGSAGAHHDQVWADMLEAAPLALLTPWVRAGGFLPKRKDLERIKSLSPEAYITALPSTVLKKKKVDKIVKGLHEADIKTVSGWGHIRARRTLGRNQWSVELAGDAVKIS